jgi:hypothetical protein
MHRPTSATFALPSCGMSCIASCAASIRRSLFVRNYTDIDDKIMDGARERGISIGELTERPSGL